MTVKKTARRTADAALAEKLIGGIGKRFANAEKLTFAGSTVTPAQVTDKLQQLVTLRSDANARHLLDRLFETPAITVSQAERWLDVLRRGE